MKKKEHRADNPDPVDIHVGGRLRLRRNLIGMSQEFLGKSLGLTFQQIQKYERGINRMGASRLFQIAVALGVDVGYFFPEMPKTGAQPASGSGESELSSHEGGSPVNAEADILNNRETLELVRAYHRIKNPDQRKHVLNLVRSMMGEK